MDFKELKQKEKDLELEFNSKKTALRDEWVKSNAKFGIGDFIYNVTGIIKVKEISQSGGDIEFLDVVYRGYKYKKVKGELIRTKEKEICLFFGRSSLMKIAI